MRYLIVLITGAVWVLGGLVPLTALAETFSLNLTGRMSNFDTPIFLHVEFGESAAGVAGVNGNDVWNDLIVYGDQGTRGTLGPWHLTGSGGGLAAATVSSQGTWSLTTSGTRIVPLEDPSGDMMDGMVTGRTDQHSFTVTVSELLDDFPTYDVYAYLTGGTPPGSKWGSITLNGSSTVDYIVRIFDGTFIEATGNNAADYVVFRDVTGDSFTISGGGNGSGTGLAGLEVVGVPEPSTLLLLGIGALGLLAYALRRQKAA
ncbi:MAG: PEP-CTERM sorting domain-containing protein [Thermoguttaceae bacterium]